MTLELTTRTEGLPRMGGHDVAVDVRCDRCGESLEPDGDGRVLWEPDPKDRYVEVTFLHGRCMEAYESDTGGELESVGLSAFLSALIHNLEEAG